MFAPRLLRQMALFSLMTVFASALVMAQDGQNGGGRRGSSWFGGGGMMRGPQIDRATLLRADQVRRELQIEEAQAATIDAALAAYQEERQASPRPDRDAFEAMTEEERMAYFEKSRLEREELSKKTDEILAALLEEPQTKRLDEIAVQVRMSFSASAALKSDDMKKKLTITDEQVAKLDEAEKAAGAEMQKMFEELRANGSGAPGGRGPGGPGGDAFRTKTEEMRKKSTAAALAVLTPEQTTVLDGLKGAAFELDMRALMGGRGFGGQGGGGGRGRGGRPPAE